VFSSACVLALALALRGPAAVGPVAERPFQQLVPHLVVDARALPSSNSAIVMGAGAMAALAVHPSDARVARWAATEGPSSYTGFGATLGNGWTQAGFAVGTYAGGLISHSAEVTHLGSDLIRAQALNGLITQVVKMSADRRRPSGGPHSFPSGHSSAAFATAAVLQRHYGWRAALPAYGLAGFIAWSRVRQDAHFMSDVLVGGALGTIVGRTIASPAHAHQWTIAPSATRNSVGVMVVKVGG
jgi:membrane-associated phospholipid phosphatase